jgi:hypothetical protein
LTPIRRDAKMETVKPNSNYDYPDLIGCIVEDATTLDLTLKHPDGRLFIVEPSSDGYGWTGFKVRVDHEN